MIRDLKFRLLCRRHSDEIYRYARGLLGNEADAEDATQEALLRLWQSLSKVPSSKARAWLYRTTRNYSLDVLRRRSREAAPQLLGDEVIEAFDAGDGAEPGQRVDSETLREKIDAALQRLSETQRSVFLLYEVNGLRYREIADHLDIPVNSVKVYLLRARKKLQHFLNHERPWTLTSTK